MNVSIDHLVYAVPDLARGQSEIRRLLGVTPKSGGQHLGRGTRNALVPLGNRSYLEIIGPDPEQPEPDEARPFGIDDLERPRLVTWAVREPHLDQRRRLALERGLDLGAPRAMTRRRPDGGELSWRLMVAALPLAGGLAPFFIDWGTAASPGEQDNQCQLVALFGESPDVAGAGDVLDRLDVDLELRPRKAVALVARIACPLGEIELR